MAITVAKSGGIFDPTNSAQTNFVPIEGLCHVLNRLTLEERQSQQAMQILRSLRRAHFHNRRAASCSRVSCGCGRPGANSSAEQFVNQKLQSPNVIDLLNPEPHEPRPKPAAA
jgi:hypothetical protein